MLDHNEPGTLPLPQVAIDVWFVPWNPAESLASVHQILDLYDTGASRLRVHRLPSGQPVVPGSQGMSISLSHSGRIAAVAVGQHCRVGVDIECLRPLDQVERLARRFLSPEEAEAVLALPSQRKLMGFFQTWVRKEAYLKGLGGGVPSKLRSFSTSGGLEEPPKILWTQLEGQGTASIWSLADLSAPSGYVGAVAFDGAIRDVRIRSESSETRGSRSREES